MGGVWERVIGILRRILDFFLMDVFGIGLIYEFLLIFFVEVFVIMNVRLLVFFIIDVENFVLLLLLLLFI